MSKVSSNTIVWFDFLANISHLCHTVYYLLLEISKIDSKCTAKMVTGDDINKNDLQQKDDYTVFLFSPNAN